MKPFMFAEKGKSNENHFRDSTAYKEENSLPYCMSSSVT